MDLSASSPGGRDFLTPIEGEAGVGYALKREYDLPPLMFDPDELEALALGARIASSFGDDALGRAGESALSKIEAVLPPALRDRLAKSPLYAPRTGAARSSSYALAVARAALTERRRLVIAYVRKDGEESERVVRPLGAFFWGKVWTLAARCELRQDFRTFRLDRLERIEAGEPFEEEPGVLRIRGTQYAFPRPERELCVVPVSTPCRARPLPALPPAPPPGSRPPAAR